MYPAAVTFTPILRLMSRQTLSCGLTTNVFLTSVDNERALKRSRNRSPARSVVLNDVKAYPP
jgi:hypothetical protein